MYLKTISRAGRLILLTSIFVVAACASMPPAPQPTQSVLPTPAVSESPLAPVQPVAVAPDPTPAPGKAAIKGLLTTTKGYGPIPGTQFYLKPALEERGDAPWTLVLVGPETEKGDVVGQSGSQGEFFVNDVPPGTYYLIVWAPYNWIPIETQEENPRPKEFKLKAGEIADLGPLVLSWP